LVEIEFNLLRSATILVDVGDALFEVHAGFDAAEDFVACTKHAVEEFEFLIEQAVNVLVGGVSSVQEVDHDHIALLAVTVAAPDALLDALRVPWKIVVYNEGAELEVNPLGSGFGGNHQDGLFAEIVHERGAHVSTRGACDVVRTR